MGLERRKFDMKDCTLDELKHYGPRLMPNMYSQTAQIAPFALVMPIFTITRAKPGEKLPVINQVFHRKGRGFVRYKGPTLTQSHLTVLLTLANVYAGGLSDALHTFYISELLSKMGWSDNADNISRVIDLLDDLKVGQLRFWAEDKDEHRNAQRESIISRFKPCENGQWELTLSEELLPLFAGTHLTNINLPTRQRLTEGLATFLYGFIKADSCALLQGFSYAELHAASGSQAKDLGQFAKDVRKRLDGFKVSGIIADYTQHRGGVRIRKK